MASLQTTTTIGDLSSERLLADTTALSESAEMCWFAACTRSRHEKLVARQLEERSINCFLPLYHSVRRWKDRRKHIDLALFPGYIFVQIRWRDRLPVLQLPGVVRFVTFSGLPVPLPLAELEALRNGLSQGAYAQAHPFLKVGKRVVVRYGPFAGATGILTRKKDNLRVVISIDAIMRSVAVEVDAADVEPLA